MKSAGYLVERRKQERFNFRRKVFTQETSELIGYVENLSLTGIKMKSMNPIPDEIEIKIWFGASEENEEEKRILLSVCKLWGSVSETVPPLYFSGLHFIYPSEEASDSIQKLISELSE
ncbi:MAG: PilZ domain-containing protein [Gammaproteobacteria bacterium]|nr:PilZ domain-containing protein [Gammaproteobacteria bacterium]